MTHVCAGMSGMVAPDRLAAMPPDTAARPFDATFSAFLEAYFALDPLAATAIGDHRYDDRWPALGPDADRAWLEAIDHWTSTFAALDPAGLDAD